VLLAKAVSLWIFDKITIENLDWEIKLFSRLQ